MTTSKTPGQARTQIKTSFNAAIAASSIAGIGIAWGNKFYARDGKEYLRFSAQHLPGQLAALGNQFYRRPLLVSVDIFVPEGEGEARTDTIMEVVLGWVETLNLAGFRVRDPVGPNDVGVFDGFNQSNVSAQMEYDSLRT